MREISRSWGVYRNAIGIDPWGDIYTADGNPDSGKITAYTPGARSTLLTILLDAAVGVAFDSSGNLYVADAAGGVVEYAARRQKRLRTIYTAANDAVALDSSDNLYVAEIKGRGSVEVFAPGAKQPFRKITDGIRTPVALLFDSAGDLYVANCRSCYDYTDPRGGSVTEYAPGSATPIRVLKQGIEAPAALALGANGVLFVADDPFMGKTAVTVYSASSKKPVRRITDGISGPASLAIGPDGDLYVANYPCCGGDDSVTVYSPNGSRLVQKVRRGVKSPTAIAIGP